MVMAVQKMAASTATMPILASTDKKDPCASFWASSVPLGSAAWIVVLVERWAVGSHAGRRQL